MNRRAFLCTAAAAFRATSRAQEPSHLPEPVRNLRPMTGGIQPITDQERHNRIEKARRLMRANKIGAVLMEGGSSSFYFSGVRQDGVLILPASGELPWVGGAADDDGKYRAIANALKDK